MEVVEEEKPSRPKHLNLIKAQDPDTSVSDKPPRDFSCRIKSFKELTNIASEFGVETYQTRTFNKDGYRWRLVIYPNGDRRNGGNGHISVYLVLVDTYYYFPVGLKVYASFSVYVFNQTQLHYSVFTDYQVQYGKEYGPIGWHKFDKMKNGYGYTQLIPLPTFEDSSSGYLVDDSCVFGVEVDVRSVYKTNTIAKINHSYDSIIRTAIKFVELENEYHDSETFTVGGQQWVLRLYPGWVNGYGKHLSLYLRLSRPKSLGVRVLRYFQGNTHKKVHAKFTLCVIDQLHDKHVKRTVCGVYSDSKPSWGCSDFMELRQLTDQSCRYLRNNNLIVEIDFAAVFGIK